VIKNAKKLAFFAVVAVFGAAVVSNFFYPASALTNSGSITQIGVALTENFDALATSGTSNPWTDNSTLPGWYAQFELQPSNPTLYIANAGGTNNGAIYSYGTGTITERAFGSQASGTPGTVYIAVKLTNNTGQSISSLDINYFGEQWRNGGNTAAQATAFQYQVANAGVITDANTPAGGWTSAAALDFVTPVTGSTAAALDGNANRIQKSANVPVSIANGQEVWLRWVDINDAGNDHGVGIDDFSVTANAAVDQAPTVTGTVPPASASNVAVNSTITINFSETVNASAIAFSVKCNNVARAFSQSASPASVFTLTPGANLPFSATCVVGVAASEILDTDTDDPPDMMAADVSFPFITAGPTDVGPSVTGASPPNGASNVPVTTNIVLTFSESVTASEHAFALDCGGPRTFTQTSSPSTTFTINPDGELPYATGCNVTVDPNEISDTDDNDPPDQMGIGVAFSFTTEDAPATNVLINELDSDQASTDTQEFVEFFDGGAGNTPLNGLVAVFFNGSNLTSYAAFDLDGLSTDVNGYFILGNSAVPGAGRIFTNNTLQNGEDAVAVYIGNATDFPNGTPVTTTNLLDAVVYDTDDPDNAGLLALLNPGEPQVNENSGGAGTAQSIGRCPDFSGGGRVTSTYRSGAPSPGVANNCPPPPPPPSSSVLVISQIYGGGGANGASYQNDYVELYNRGTVTVDTLGWTLQYAAFDGSGWNFNKTPLGGPIAPGEYYLVKLASSGGDGAPVPAANATGLTNISSTQGKLAIVDSFDGLVGNCPTSNPHVKDFVGYGAADCAEGPLTALSPSATTAVFRKNGGNTDTDFNSLDFDLPVAPTPRRTAPIVELPPLVMGIDGSNGGVNFNVPRDPTIAVTFTEPVFVNAGWFDLTCSVTGSHNSHTFAGNGRILDITPNVNMQAGESCTLTLFKDLIHDQDSDDAVYDTPLANVSWPFTISIGTAPPYASSVHLTFGNPTNATNDVNQFNNYLMDKPEYALSYNRDQGRPNWVSWHLSDEWYGSLFRIDTFRADPQVPPDWYRVQGFDFSGSGFDRGHMVPNADRDKETSVPINQATYLMTNMVAQAPDNNQGPWADFENYLRTLTDAGNELYIVAGPQGTGGTGSNGFTNTITNDRGQVTVAAFTWKAVLVLPKANGDDLSHVTCSTRSIAIIMPNTQGIRDDDWHDYLRSIDAVEALTGYDLFSNLPAGVEYCIEADVDGPLQVPADTHPPLIHCESPDGAWHGENITLACTATDSESGLDDHGDASFSLVTLVPDGTSNSNAATDTREVCDAVGNCATAGPIAGNMIDRENPAASLTTPADGAVYMLNDIVNASFACADGGSGVGSCIGTSASGSPIDTASSGPKIFSVTAIDGVGNALTVAVTYTVSTGPSHKRTPSISITNPPATATQGASFTPGYSYDGDGVIHLASLTPSVCKIKADSIVNFIGAGTCTLVASATPTGSVNAARGPAQSFLVLP
jgi:endonuclease G, mitochondrial